MDAAGQGAILFSYLLKQRERGMIRRKGEEKKF
jgi:hypothetical protein